MQRKKAFIPLLHFVNTYSIWVALGSFSCYIFFCRLYGTASHWAVAAGLALGVWFIYTLDHLLDGLVLRDKANTLRHKKHFDQSGFMKNLLILVAVLLLLLGFFVPSFYYRFITLLGVLTVIHFGINYLVPSRFKKLFFLKEVFIAFVVSLGIAGSALVGDIKVADQWSDLPFYIFLFINLANILLFSYFDREVDEKTDTLSIASLYGDFLIRRIIYICLVVSVLLVVWEFTFGRLEFIFFLVLFAMQITLFFITLFSSYFQVNDRYRFYGDLIYVYPLLAWPFLS